MAKAATSINHEPYSSLRSDRVAGFDRNGWPASSECARQLLEAASQTIRDGRDRGLETPILVDQLAATLEEIRGKESRCKPGAIDVEDFLTDDNCLGRSATITLAGRRRVKGGAGDLGAVQLSGQSGRVPMGHLRFDERCGVGSAGA